MIDNFDFVKSKWGCYMFQSVNVRLFYFQAIVRERLVNLLNSCGQRVGLPKSPSVSIVDQIVSK
jgi:hypothetical protein